MAWVSFYKANATAYSLAVIHYHPFPFETCRRVKWGELATYLTLATLPWQQLPHLNPRRSFLTPEHVSVYCLSCSNNYMINALREHARLVPPLADASEIEMTGKYFEAWGLASHFRGKAYWVTWLLLQNTNVFCRTLRKASSSSRVR